MRLILIIIFGLIALHIAASLIGPLIGLGVGAALIYYAYKNLVKPNNSVPKIILWVIIGAIGVSMFIHSVPGFLFVGAIAALVYFIARNSSSKSKSQFNKATDSKGPSVYQAYESFETEWREVTNR